MQFSQPAAIAVMSVAVMATGEAARATEIDSFTGRYEPLENAAHDLNNLTNDWLLDAAKAANRKGSCSEGAIYDAVSRRFLGTSLEALTWTAFEVFLDEQSVVQLRHTKLKNSVYQSLEFWDGLVLSIAELGPTFTFDGHVVGTDKIGHFFGTGYQYFDKAHNNGKGVEAAYSFGIWTEEQFYGAGTIGVYSFGDLAANHHGLEFWEDLIDDRVPSENPYFECVSGEWLQSRTFDWRDYVDESWDEGINCSGYGTDTMKNAVEEQIRALEQEDGKRYMCPVSEKACADAVANHPYGSYWDVTISPVCVAAAAELGVEPTEPASGLGSGGNGLCRWSEFFLNTECEELVGCNCGTVRIGPRTAMVVIILCLIARCRRYRHA